MSLETIATILEDAGLGKQGTDIFLYRMPAEASGFLLRDGYSGDVIDHELPGYRKGDFMLIYRTPDVALGKEKMKEAMAALNFLDATYETAIYKYCRPRRDPMVYPISIGSNFEVAVPFDACYILI